MGAGKALGIIEGILFFPHRLASSLPPSSGVQRTAERHLIVYPFASNLEELLREGLRVEVPETEQREAMRSSSLCRTLGLTTDEFTDIAAELSNRRVYVLPRGFDPINNLQHARDFENADIVLCTDAAASIACAGGAFRSSDFIAIWFDEVQVLRQFALPTSNP